MDDRLLCCLRKGYTLHEKVHGANHLNRLRRQVCEELGEFLVAVSHQERGRVPVQKLVDEFADIQICIWFLYKALKVHPDAPGAAFTKVATRLERVLTKIASGKQKNKEAR